jgi:hypothetical protein
MSSRSRKTWVLVPVALATIALMPAVSGANPLLSGYGGPGQGDQAILGATLLNSPGGGGGSSASGDGEASSTALTVPSGTANSTTRTSAKRPGPGRRHRAKGAAPTRGSSTNVPAVAPGGGSARLVAPSTGDDAGGSLGLSAADIAYLVLALAGLALTGVFTRQLARGPHQRRTG